MTSQREAKQEEQRKPKDMLLELLVQNPAETEYHAGRLHYKNGVLSKAEYAEIMSRVKEKEGKTDLALSYLQDAIKEGADTADNYERLADFHASCDGYSLGSFLGDLLIWTLSKISGTSTFERDEKLKQREIKRMKKRTIESLEKALEKDPKRVRLYHKLADLNKDNPDKVIDYAQKALEILPEDERQRAVFYAFLSNVYHDQPSGDRYQRSSQDYLLQALDAGLDVGLVRKFFFDRLDERLEQTGGTMLEQVLNIQEGRNRHNPKVGWLVVDYLRSRNDARINRSEEQDLCFWYVRRFGTEDFETLDKRKDEIRSTPHYSMSERLEHFLERWVQWNPDHQHFRYELGVGYVLQAGIDRSGNARNEHYLGTAIQQFSELRKQGFDVRNGRYKVLTDRFLDFYGDQIENPQSNKPVLTLVKH